MKANPSKVGSGAKRAPSAKKVAAKRRDYAGNARKPAPHGRYEDKSPKPAPKKRGR
jgi:hypothetical protein